MRYGWLALAAIVFSAPSFASIEAKLSQCQNINDKLDRLICYDNLAKSVNSSSSHSSDSSPVVRSNIVQPTVSVVAPEDDFGRVKPKPDAIERLTLTVARVTKNPYGAMKISFTNNQTWKQIDSRRFRIKKGDTVYIKKGALGSFLLGMEGRNSTIRVKREK
ncbi:hypothetical protein [Parashewanella tropica]|uniref:hypothetical protein n=1 Tax=Parashewanella tropica TaxID=2547970 RepID=UPI00105A193F|nr:hypothetical protein [Parashewanella tropica]